MMMSDDVTPFRIKLGSRDAWLLGASFFKLYSYLLLAFLFGGGTTGRAIFL
jgi:hypothetical protein